MEKSLGQLEKIDLRTVWTNEASDFTPWLANENLELLGKTIGVDDLELEGTEKNVGPFNADILCKDTVSDQWVLVENQLERTDHGHLGQLLTYAAGLNAVTIVWISARFTEEHRAALDWLNESTDEGINFFGLEIELWRIGESPIAPKFDIVSKPNDWSKRVSSAARRDEELTEIKQLQLEYWTEFSRYLEENSQRITPRTPRAQHWANFSIGRSKCRLGARVNTVENAIGVELVLADRDEAEPLFYLLEENRETIESEVEASLDWNQKPSRKRCTIDITWQNEDPTDKSHWPEQHRRLADMLERFYEAFAPRLKRLDASEYAPEQPSENARTDRLA